jgi:hypothetical protein
VVVVVVLDPPGDQSEDCSGVTKGLVSGRPVIRLPAK